MQKTGLAAKYQQIALDLAQRIINKEFNIGEKLYGRSKLASTYNVSPETIRKAVSLLEEMDVLKVNVGSGILVNSVRNAYNFIQRYKYQDSIGSLKHKLDLLNKQRNVIEQKLHETVDTIVEYSDRLRNLSPYNPIEIEISKNSKYIGCTISEIRFWQNTGATIVALKKDDTLIVSPGPYAKLEQGNILVVVGGDNVIDNVNIFLNNKTQK